MVKKKGVKKRETVKRVSRKKVGKVSRKKRTVPKKKFRKSSNKSVKKTIVNFKNKKVNLLVNLIRFTVLFVLFLVLYYATSNYLLEVLFGIGALIFGAIVVALILVWVGFVLFKYRKSKK